jgi:hypothetical protein
MKETDVCGPARQAVGINAIYEALRDAVEGAIILRESLMRRYLLDSVAQSEPVVRWCFRLAGVRFWATPMLRFIGAFGPTKRAGDSARASLIALATDAERDLPEFKHATAEFWIESFAADCCTRFCLDTVKLLGLRQVDTMRNAPSPYQRLTSPQRFFAVAGIALGLFASLVPKEAFEALGWTAHTYGAVRAFLAFVILAIAGYLAFIAMLNRVGAGRIERRVSQAMPDILTYCEITCRTPQPEALHLDG